MELKQILKKLKSHANPKNIEGMARFGINPKNTYGISIPVLRKTAKEVGITAAEWADSKKKIAFILLMAKLSTENKSQQAGS